MAEYIEREAVKRALLGWDCDPSDDDVEFAINEIPPADVVEVRHGVWIRHKENCLYNKCSICSYEHCREDNYCPNCGADMRGDDNVDL